MKHQTKIEASSLLQFSFCGWTPGQYTVILESSRNSNLLDLSLPSCHMSLTGERCAVQSPCHDKIAQAAEGRQGTDVASLERAGN